MDRKQGHSGLNSTKPALTRLESRVNGSRHNNPAGMDLEPYIMDNLNAFLNTHGGTEVELITKDLPLECQFYELKERECLRELQRCAESIDAEIQRKHTSFVMSLPREVLKTKLSALIARADNAPNFEVMKQRLLENIGEDDSDDGDTENNASDDTQESIPAAVNVNESPRGIPSTQNRHSPIAIPSDPAPVPAAPVATTAQSAIDDLALPSTPKNTSGSSEEFFQTPRTHFDGTTTLMFNQNQTRARGKTIVLPPRNDAGTSRQPGEFFVFPPPPVFQEPAAPPVFQFVGNTAKEPRLLKPGEVLFSSTGSPIAIPPQSAPSSVASSVPSMPVEAGIMTPPPQGTAGLKTIHLKVDNPNGPAFQVEMVCREDGREQQELFRNFVTDVRGFITTRSMAQNKVMAPRVIASSATRKGKGKRKCPSSSRKPQWRV